MAFIAHIVCPLLCDDEVDPFTFWHATLDRLRGSSMTSLYITAPAMGFRIFELLLCYIYDILDDVDIVFVNIDVQKGLLRYGHFWTTHPTRKGVWSLCRMLFRRVEKLQILLGIRFGIVEIHSLSILFPAARESVSICLCTCGLWTSSGCLCFFLKVSVMYRERQDG